MMTPWPRERQFTLFKQWAINHADALRAVLDRSRSAPERPIILDTPWRAALLAGLPVVPVRVI